MLKLLQGGKADATQVSHLLQKGVDPDVHDEVPYFISYITVPCAGSYWHTKFGTCTEINLVHFISEWNTSTLVCKLLWTDRPGRDAVKEQSEC